MKTPSMGLPAGNCRVSGLLYNQSAGTLVAIVDPTPAVALEIGRHLRRVFIRQAHEQLYRELSMPDEDIFPAEVVTCAAAPVLYMNTHRWVDERGLATNPEGVVRVWLPDGRQEALSVDRAGSRRRILASQLVGATASGDSIFIVGDTGGESQGGRHLLSYGLLEVPINSGRERHIANLPAFFA